MATSSRKPADQPKPDEQELPAEEQADQPAEERSRDGICVRCWPDGWPTKDTNQASCEHGTWQR